MTVMPRIVVGILALLCATAQARPTSRGIDYEVRRLGNASDGYEVTLRFKGAHSGRSMLTIPGEWASATHAERGIEDLAVMTPGARLEETDEPRTKRIVHRPDAPLIVRYVLKQIAHGVPSATANTQFLPVIQQTYFEWIGWTAWVIPTDDNRRRVRIHLAFRDLPDGWAFASSYGLDATAVEFDGPIDRFQSALFVGGDFRLRSRPARGGSVITAVRGDWTFGDNALADRVSRIVDAERAFWEDHSQRFYLIALLPLTGLHSSTGTGLSQSFVTFVTPDTPIADLDFLWSHEYFHAWNNGQLGQFPEPQSQLYWFSEGFTDYYMKLVQLRLGLLSLAQYAQAYDEAIRFVAELPDGPIPNSEVVERFFTDPRVVGRLPYSRGMLLAAQWDAQIRAASGGVHSLDDAMRTLYRQHRRGVEMLDAHRIVAVVQSYGVRDAAGDLDRQIERGELPRLADEVLTPCISIEDATAPRVDIGFDLTRSIEQGTIIGVDPDGPAYAAGLRDGPALRSLRSIDRAEHIVEAAFQESRDDEIRTIRYRALGRDLIRQHVTLRHGLDDPSRARCMRTLGAQ